MQKQYLMIIFTQNVYEVPLQRILEISSVYLWGGYLNEISHNVKNVPISRSYLDKYEMLYEQPKRVCTIILSNHAVNTLHEA